MIENSEISVFATCPPLDPGLPDYPGRVAETSRWSEAHGCRGALVYTDNGMLDPWLVAQLMIERTERLRPLVAVQPVYRHPYTVAKAITSLAALSGRAVDLNWVAGGYERVGQVLAHHLGCGYRRFILDVPFEEDDLVHARRTFAVAAEQTLAAEGGTAP